MFAAEQLIKCKRSASAEELQTEAIYDLERGGTQSFWVQDENGEIGKIVIREVRGTSRVKDGSYEVSYDHTGYWEAGFCVKIGDNKITSAYSPFHSVYSGKITQATLTKNSTSKASYLFIYQQAILSYNAGVIATISDSKLVVKKR